MKNNKMAVLFGIRIRIPRDWDTYVYQNKEYRNTFVYENVYQCIPTYANEYILNYCRRLPYLRNKLYRQLILTLPSKRELQV